MKELRKLEVVKKKGKLHEHEVAAALRRIFSRTERTENQVARGLVELSHKLSRSRCFYHDINTVVSFESKWKRQRKLTEKLLNGMRKVKSRLSELNRGLHSVQVLAGKFRGSEAREWLHLQLVIKNVERLIRTRSVREVRKMHHAQKVKAEIQKQIHQLLLVRKALLKQLQENRLGWKFRRLRLERKIDIMKAEVAGRYKRVLSLKTRCTGVSFLGLIWW